LKFVIRDSNLEQILPSQLIEVLEVKGEELCGMPCLRLIV
jgi:hypothetical protein